MKKLVYFIILLIPGHNALFSQITGGNTLFTTNLTSSPTATEASENIAGDDNCCLENFYGNYNSLTRQIDLAWSTTSETNNRWFLCEKSIHGDDWTCMDTIHSMGHSNTTQFYNSSDPNPSPQAYYRLVQEDRDGNKTIFDPVLVYAKDKEAVSCHIYPNPTEGDFYIQFNQEVNGVLYLTDGSGKLCNTTQINSMRQEIQTNDLPPGTYFVEVRLERYFYGTKIIIQ